MLLTERKKIPEQYLNRSESLNTFRYYQTVYETVLYTLLALVPFRKPNTHE